MTREVSLKVSCQTFVFAFAGKCSLQEKSRNHEMSQKDMRIYYVIVNVITTVRWLAQRRLGSVWHINLPQQVGGGADSVPSGRHIV